MVVRILGAIALLVSVLSWPTYVLPINDGALSIDERLQPLLKDANARVRRLLDDHAYMKRVFTDPAKVLGSDIAVFPGSDPVQVRLSRPVVPASAEEVPCSAVPHQRLGVILSAGQSNAASTTPVDQIYKPRHRFFSYDVENGHCYVAMSPVPGNSGLGTSFIVPLGDELIEAGLFDNVLVVPFALGGTFVQEWRPGGRYFDRFTKALGGIHALGLTPTAILWQQGEGNAQPLASRHTIGIYGSVLDSRPIDVTDDLKLSVEIAYVEDFLSIVKAIREAGSTAPVFVARSTTCGPSVREPTIRAAQSYIPDAAWGIHAGPDTDAIDPSNRFDLCHFDLNGQRLHARAWLTVLADYLGKAMPLAGPPWCSVAMKPVGGVADHRARLVWESRNADRITANLGIGQLAAAHGEADVTVSDAETPLRVTVATRDGLQSACSGDALGHVPACRLDAAASTISKGATTRLRWTAENVTAVELDQGLGGSLPLSGSTLVTPSSDTSYRLTATVADGRRITCEATVRVLDTRW